MSIKLTGRSREEKDNEAYHELGEDNWNLTLTLSGKGRVGLLQGECIAQEGDIFLHRPHTLIDFGIERECGHWETLWAQFFPRPEWLPWLNWPEAAPGIMRLTLEDPALRAKVTSRFLDVHHLMMGALPLHDLLAMNALEEVLLWCETANPLSPRQNRDARVEKVIHHLCLNLAEKSSLCKLAAIGGLSVSGLEHLFRRQMGMTLNQFLEMQRMNRARQLLEMTPRSIQAIAAEVGYENPFYFTLRFKRQHGVSPSDYRKQIALRGAEGA